MKSAIAVGILSLSFIATSAFGQGWLQLFSQRSQAWDDFTGPVPTVSSLVNVALFWAPGAYVANPMPLANSPTNGLLPYAQGQLWLDLSTSGFTLAQDESSGNANVIVPTTTRGVVNYAPGGFIGNGWSLNGSAAGGTITLLEIGWSSAYATPGAAQAADSPIGWSYLNSFVLATAPIDPSITQPLFVRFGVSIYIPEPSTLMLTGLSGLSLMLLRRRK